MKIQYDLPGDATYQSKLYPPASVVDDPVKVYFSTTGETLQKPREVSLKTPEDMIAHYTLSSLHADGIRIVDESMKVHCNGGKYSIEFDADESNGMAASAKDYAKVHPVLMDENHAGQAINGVEAAKSIAGVWNPLSGYKVNHHEVSEWALFLPLGMPMVNHKAVTLLHYPPSIAMRDADYLHNVTLQRWQNLLNCVDVSDHWLYDTFVDVNPIAAPGSGESEYPNDYFPIMLSSAFFDSDSVPGPDGKRISANYIRSMLEELLNPPRIREDKSRKYTLPLLVGGSPLYDPQAPGWFRVRYKDALPTKPEHDKHGIPQANVMQVGLIKINENSEKLTPYMIANHMIAAGVTGAVTTKPGKIPDIRRYEGEDLVAAEFLSQYDRTPNIAPEQAKKNACKRWFGNENGKGEPVPPSPGDKILLGAMAIRDLFFDVITLEPFYSWNEAYDKSAELGDAVFKTVDNPLAQKYFEAEQVTYTKWNWR